MNEDLQQRVFDSIGSGFERTDYGTSTLQVLALIIPFILIVYFSFLISKHKVYLKGRYIYWKKRWKGEAVSKDRMPQHLEIVIQIPYQDRPFRTHLHNISPNGMYVKMNPPLMVGESFRFLLNLNDDERISAWAEVRWSLENRTIFTPPGMGCKFFHLSDADRNRIKRFLRQKK